MPQKLTRYYQVRYSLHIALTQTWLLKPHSLVSSAYGEVGGEPLLEDKGNPSGLAHQPNPWVELK